MISPPDSPRQGPDRGFRCGFRRDLHRGFATCHARMPGFSDGDWGCGVSILPTSIRHFWMGS